MVKLLQTADIHLQAPSSVDSSYSLQCLGNIIQRAHQDKVDAILFCGDIFDKESDYTNEHFLEKVVSILDSARVPIYYVPGNHENLAGNFSKMKTVHWGKNVRLATEVSLIRHSPELELLLIPHNPSYDNYMDWKVPSKESAVRIALAHGEIPGFQFLGDEEAAGVLNSAIFLDHQVEHIFLGHIHLQEVVTDSEVSFYYAGSPRVVRRKESGVRGYNLIEVSDKVKVTRKFLPEMGVMHRLESSILVKNWEQEIEESFSGIEGNDRVRIQLEGLINEEDLHSLDEKIEKLQAKLKLRCRRVEIVKSLEPIGNLTQNPFYKKVYETWLKREPQNHESREYEVWLHSLEKLKYITEKVLP